MIRRNVMMHSILVKDYMSSKITAVAEQSSLTEAVDLFCNEHLQGIAVINENKQVVGFISEQDCIKELLNDSYYYQEPPTVASTMQKSVVSVTPNTSIIEIAEMILASKARRFPVIENDKLVGMISRTDILKAIVESRKDIFYHTKPA